MCAFMCVQETTARKLASCMYVCMHVRHVHMCDVTRQQQITVCLYVCMHVHACVSQQLLPHLVRAKRACAAKRTDSLDIQLLHGEDHGVVVDLMRGRVCRFPILRRIEKK
jgi:hypothetical protein